MCDTFLTFSEIFEVNLFLLYFSLQQLKPLYKLNVIHTEWNMLLDHPPGYCVSIISQAY